MFNDWILLFIYSCIYVCVCLKLIYIYIFFIKPHIKQNFFSFFFRILIEILIKASEQKKIDSIIDWINFGCFHNFFSFFFLLHCQKKKCENRFIIALNLVYVYSKKYRFFSLYWISWTSTIKTSLKCGIYIQRLCVLLWLY